MEQSIRTDQLYRHLLTFWKAVVPQSFVRALAIHMLEFHNSITRELHVLMLRIHSSGDVLGSRGYGVSGAHNRFTHYLGPTMKVIQTNSGSIGMVSIMVPSLRHVYTVSISIGKVEYIPRKIYMINRNKDKQVNTLSIIENILLLFQV